MHVVRVCQVVTTERRHRLHRTTSGQSYRLGCHLPREWLCSISWCVYQRAKLKLWGFISRALFHGLYFAGFISRQRQPERQRRDVRREGRIHEPLRNSDNRHLRDFDRDHVHGGRVDPAAFQERMCRRPRCRPLGIPGRGADGHGLAGHAAICSSFGNG